MLQVEVRSEVNDPIERVSFQDVVGEGISPDPANEGEKCRSLYSGPSLA